MKIGDPITTYRLQVAHEGNWQPVNAHDGTPLEFLFRSHALFVAKLIEGAEKHPTPALRIVDSRGNYHPV